MRRVATKEFAARKSLALLLAFVVLNCSIVTVRAQSENEARRIAKVKRAVNKIGIDGKVDVRLMDGSVVKGHISEIGDLHFVLVNKKTGDSRTFTFAQVREVKRPSSELVAILGVALIPLVVGVVIWAGRQD